MSEDPNSSDAKQGKADSPNQPPGDRSGGDAPCESAATNPMTSDPVADGAGSDDEATSNDEGPGCFPAVLAATVLMGIFGFIFCGVSTWYLYQQRTTLAIRTLEDGYLPQIEQSLLDEETKAQVLIEVKSLMADMKRGKLEDWQSAGVMQRIQRLPVLQWGDMQATEAFVKKNGTPPQIIEASNQFKRIRAGVQGGSITSFDLYDMLAPVQVEDYTVASGKRLKQPLSIDDAMATAALAKSLADRERLPDPANEEGRIQRVLRDEIQAGIESGGY